MEHYFSFHGIIDDLMKLQVGVFVGYVLYSLHGWCCTLYVYARRSGWVTSGEKPRKKNCGQFLLMFGSIR
jgi:hypothetical protein